MSKKPSTKSGNKDFIFKLQTIDVPHQLIHLLRFFLLERLFKVKICDSFLTSRKISVGIPRGSCLSPHIFSIYINNLPKDKEPIIAFFADDKVFYALGPTNNAAIKRVQRRIYPAVS